MRIANWYSGLGFREKVLVWLAATVVLALASYWGTLLVLSLLGYGGQGNSQGAANAPGVTSPGGGTGSGSAGAVPNIGVKIASARWEGEKAVVEGTWKGDLSSVHCDLLQGGDQGRATDWWDRGVPAKMNWSHKTFTQVFVQAKGTKIKNPVDPNEPYWVRCSGLFSGGWSTSGSAKVEGTPPS